MSQRYRITREMKATEASPQTITLDECKHYFQSKTDFTYTSVFTVAGSNGSAGMSIDGDFFMWSIGGKDIPFRHYQGDLYVSGTNEVVIPKMVEIATDLEADIVEG